MNTMIEQCGVCGHEFDPVTSSGGVMPLPECQSCWDSRVDREILDRQRADSLPITPEWIKSIATSATADGRIVYLGGRLSVAQRGERWEVRLGGSPVGWTTIRGDVRTVARMAGIILNENQTVGVM